MRSLIAANLSCLRQGKEFLSGITDTLYREPCGTVFNSTIGGHFRHNLDHYEAFLGGYGSGSINYDQRDRSLQVEENRDRAIAMMDTQEMRLEGLGSCRPDHPLKICMDDGGESIWSATTLQRELQFLLSHTIHHYALVVAIAARFGCVAFPSNFGIAPSTFHYRAATTS